MDQPKVSIVYHGQGALHVLAEEVAAGAEEVGALTRIRRLPSHARTQPGSALVDPEEAHWADAVVLGSPSRYGNLAPPLRSYVQELGPAEAGRLGRIVLSGFAADDSILHGGREATLRTLFHVLRQLGGVLVPVARTEGADARAVARQTGRDVAAVARRLLVGAATDSRESLVPMLSTTGASGGARS